MGSLALLPVGYLVAGPIAASLGATTTLAIGSVIGLVLLALSLAPRSTRQLTSKHTRERSDRQQVTAIGVTAAAQPSSSRGS